MKIIKTANYKQVENYRISTYKELKEIGKQKITSEENKQLIEELAELEHDQWSHWTKYMLDNLTEKDKEQWRRQIKTDYKDLTEKEKE